MELDEADLAILRALQADSRISYRQLAKLARVSTPTVSAKVRALEAKGALRGYPANLAPEALGEHVLMIEVRARPSEMEAVAKKLSAMPEVRACHLVGSGRAVAFATLLDPGLSNDFVRRISAIPQIDALETFPLMKTLKDMPLAIVDRGVMLAVRCEFCGRRTKDDVIRVKVGEIVHFACCQSCQKGFQERVSRLSKLAGRGKAKSDLKMAAD